jgi:hypothetical protein
MNRRLAVFAKTTAVVLMSGIVSSAHIAALPNSVTIEQPAALPEPARAPGIALHLNTASGDGRAYLYVEQENGSRLVVFDVTDVAHIRMLRAVTLPSDGPFDFVGQLGDSAAVIRYRDRDSEALLDLRKPSSPMLKSLHNPSDAGQPDLAVPAATANATLRTNKAPHDYRVIDASDPTSPSVVYTAHLVTDSAVREETGTTFLLGESGLTIVRHPQREEEYEAQQMAN